MHAVANNYTLTKQRRSQVIVDGVANIVRDSSRIFHDLVQILKNEPAYDPIARQLQGELLQGPNPFWLWKMRLLNYNDINQPYQEVR